MSKVSVFKSIGDCEYVSSSYKMTGRITRARHYWNHQTDFNNPDYFENHRFTNQGEGYTYNSYLTNSINSNGYYAPIDGKPMGRTAYFTTASDGTTLLYPNNHYIYHPTSKEDINLVIYDGTQCISGSAEQGYYASRSPGALIDPLGHDGMADPAACVERKRVKGSNADGGVYVGYSDPNDTKYKK